MLSIPALLPSDRLSDTRRVVDARDILRALNWATPPFRGTRGKREETSYELEGQAGDWSVDCCCDVPSIIRASKRRAAAGCGIGAVSVDGWGMGDFRSAICKVEMTKKFSRRCDGTSLNTVPTLGKHLRRQVAYVTVGCVVFLNSSNY